MKFTQNGKIIIKILPFEDLVSFEVIDNGKGMDKSNFLKIG